MVCLAVEQRGRVSDQRLDNYDNSYIDVCVLIQYLHQKNQNESCYDVNLSRVGNMSCNFEDVEFYGRTTHGAHHIYILSHACYYDLMIMT